MAIERTADPVRKARSRLANASKRRNDDPAKITEARRDLHAAKLQRAIQEALAAPGISESNRAELIQLLQGGDRA